MGAGPFKPGFSKNWCDPEFAPGQQALPTWLEEFGKDAINRLSKPHEHHFGSAVRITGELRKWFSETERLRLAMLGYNIAAITNARILAESENQLLIGRQEPFANCILIPWTTI